MFGLRFGRKQNVDGAKIAALTANTAKSAEAEPNVFAYTDVDNRSGRDSKTEAAAQNLINATAPDTQAQASAG
jgi:hypothetical protein